MPSPSAVVLGGGLSGAATAWALARSGWKVTVVERGPKLGGLAGSFEIEDRFYPLGYHHILQRDRTLLYFLDAIGALDRVRWRKIRMLFEADRRLYDLAHPVDFLRFPMSAVAKLRLAGLVLRAWGRGDWSDWKGRDAEQLLDSWAGPVVREVLFEPLTRLKFDLPCRDVSAAWMGERLRYREGSSPLGHIPRTNWTTVLCDGVARLLAEAGVQARLGATVEKAHVQGSRVVSVETSAGETLEGDVFVSTVPTEVYARLLPNDETPEMRSIRYTALLSLICTTTQSMPRDFYWLNLSSLSHTACGLFVLSSLNPTIGMPGETSLNFVTHVASRERAVFALTEEELLDRYRADFHSLFGFELETRWHHLSRVPFYSPVFVRDYRNPPSRSATYTNMRFAGTYCTHPSVASTGTALQSGLDCAERVVAEAGGRSPLAAAARAFRPRRPWERSVDAGNGSERG